MDNVQVRVLEDEYLPNVKLATPHPAVEGNAKENLWYLAYGSNMAESTFLKRRGIQALATMVVHCPSLQLTFDLPAVPYLEPRMGNVRYISSSEITEWDPINNPERPWGQGLVGVAYLITPEDMARIFATEGGGNSYLIIDVECKEILGEGREMSKKPRSIVTRTLLAGEDRTRTLPGQASLRYLNLLRKGAREKSLPTQYIAYLDALQHYHVTHFRQRIGQFLFLLIAIPLGIVLFSIGSIFKKKDGTNPAWLSKLFRKLMEGGWKMYDSVFAPVFGSGEVTES